MGGTVVVDSKHPIRVRVGLGGHHLGEQPLERLDAGLGLHPAQHPGVVHVVGGPVPQRAAAFVLVLGPDRLAILGR